MLGLAVGAGLSTRSTHSGPFARPSTARAFTLTVPGVAPPVSLPRVRAPPSRAGTAAMRKSAELAANRSIGSECCTQPTRGRRGRWMDCVCEWGSNGAKHPRMGEEDKGRERQPRPCLQVGHRFPRRCAFCTAATLRFCFPFSTDGAHPINVHNCFLAGFLVLAL